MRKKRSGCHFYSLIHTMTSSSQVRFRITFEHAKRKEPFDLGIRQFYVGSICPNACNRHGTCTHTRQCR